MLILSNNGNDPISDLPGLQEDWQIRLGKIFERKLKEIQKNHTYFHRYDCLCPENELICKNKCDLDIRRQIYEEKMRLGLKGRVNSRELIITKNKEHIWLQLLYKEEDSVVPNSVGKYFNNSRNRLDYEMNGDAELEIFQFPKSEFPTYRDLVKEFEKEYFIFPPRNNQRDFNVLECSAFELSQNEDGTDEVLLDIKSLYDNAFIKFRSPDLLFNSEDREYDLYDFLPGRQGYKSKPQVRLRCLFSDNGNEFEALYETDVAFIYLSSGTS